MNTPDIDAPRRNEGAGSRCEPGDRPCRCTNRDSDRTSDDGRTGPADVLLPRPRRQLVPSSSNPDDQANRADDESHSATIVTSGSVHAMRPRRVDEHPRGRGQHRPQQRADELEGGRSPLGARVTSELRHDCPFPASPASGSAVDRRCPASFCDQLASLFGEPRRRRHHPSRSRRPEMFAGETVALAKSGRGHARTVLSYSATQRRRVIGMGKVAEDGWSSHVGSDPVRRELRDLLRPGPHHSQSSSFSTVGAASWTVPAGMSLCVSVRRHSHAGRRTKFFASADQSARRL